MFLLPFRQEIFSLSCGLVLLVIIIELIRRRKLLEQYSVIWFAIGTLCLTYLWWYPLSISITKFIGAGNVSATILFFGLLFCFLIVLQLCVKITEFTHRIKDLTQEISILRFELEQTNKKQIQEGKQSQMNEQ